MKLDYCFGSIFDTHVILIDDKPYVNFVYCCMLRINTLMYPLEKVSENFDLYYQKAIDFVKNNKICERCNHFLPEEDINNMMRYGVDNCGSLKCTQGCKYCGARATHKFHKQISQYKNQLLDAILTSNKLETVTPAGLGEPFEDDYIKDYFLFNLHKIKSLKRVRILTNAVHLDREYLERLSEYYKSHNITVDFVIDIAGSNKQVYESYCTAKFEPVIKNINDIVELFGDEHVELYYIISSHNMNINYAQTLKEFKECLPNHNKLETMLSPTYDYTVYSNMTDINARIKHFYGEKLYEEFKRKDVNLKVPNVLSFNRNDLIRTYCN